MPVKKVGPNQYEIEPQVIKFRPAPHATVSSGFTPKTEKMRQTYEGILAKIRELKRSHYNPDGSVSRASEEQPSVPVEQNRNFQGRTDTFFGMRGRVEIYPIKETER